jgi:hypothetical protein
MSAERTTGADDAMPAGMGLCRRVLRLLPRAYREQRGEELLGVMLDAASADGRSRPRIAELLSVLGLSLRLRTGAPGAGPRARSVGEALRLITLIGLLLQAAVFTFAPTELLQLVLSPTPGVGFATGVSQIGDWHFACELAGFAGPFLALAALLRGRRVLGLILTANVPAVIAAFQLTAADMYRYPAASAPTYYTVALSAVPTVCGVLGFHREAPRVPRPGYWFAAVFVLTVPLLVLAGVPMAGQMPMYTGFIVACGFVAVGLAVSRSPRGAVWPAALMVAGAPLLITLPSSMFMVDAFRSTAIFTRLAYINPTLWIAVDALAVEVLLALTLAVTLLRRLRTSDGGGAGVASG